MTEPLILIFTLVSIAALILLLLYLSTKNNLDEVQKQLQSQAQAQFQAWRDKELESLRVEQKNVARREAIAELEQWKIEYEAAIRQDAIVRSKAVIIGKVTEHLIPHMPVFPYNPKDARFIGSPVDLIVFDGADEGLLRDVIFLEIKTGSASLSQRQRQIRDAVEAGKVRWRVLQI